MIRLIGFVQDFFTFELFETNLFFRNFMEILSFLDNAYAACTRFIIVHGSLVFFTFHLFPLESNRNKSFSSSITTFNRIVSKYTPYSIRVDFKFTFAKKSKGSKGKKKRIFWFVFPTAIEKSKQSRQSNINKDVF